MFTLRSGETWRDPFGSYAALREHDPVHHVGEGDYWVLTRFADVWSAAGDPATFSSSRGLTVSYGTHYCIGAAAARLQSRVVLEELLARCPEFTVDAERGRYAEGSYVRRHLTLPFAAR